MKVKSKISYLGERNSILLGQMTEQLVVEVNVKISQSEKAPSPIIVLPVLSYFYCIALPQELHWIRNYIE